MGVLSIIMARPKLTYFNLEGVAESIRCVFRAANVDFEDYRIEFADFYVKKKEFPLGKLPLLEMDGRKMNQSGAILRHLGAKYGMFPQESLFEIEQILGTIEDVKSAVNPILYMEMVPGRFGMDGMTKDEINKCRENIANKAKSDESLPAMFKELEMLITQTGIMKNNKLIISDIQLYTLIRFMKSGRLGDYIPMNFMDQFETLNKFYDKAHQLCKSE